MLFPTEKLFKKRTLPYLAGFAVTAVLLFWGACEFYSQFGVLKIHLKFLGQIHRGQYLVVLHPGIYWMTNILSWISGLGLHVSMNLLLSFHIVLAFFAAMWALMLMTSYRMSAIFCAVLSFALLFLGPIGIPFLLDPPVYDFAKHNRNFLMLRNSTAIGVLPYAIASLGLLGYLINDHLRGDLFSIRAAILLVIFLVLSCFMKPSLAISLIPAIMIYIICSKRFSFDDVVIMAGILAPAGLLILLQFFIGFIFNPLSSQTIHIVFSPMTVWLKNNQYPLLEFILALAFPLFVSYHCRRALSPLTIVAWINIAIALVPYILLDEVKEISTSSDRDFEWSYIIAKQALFLTAIRELWIWYEGLTGRDVLKNSAIVAAISLLGLHLSFGVARLILVDAVDVNIRSGGVQRSEPLPLSEDWQ